MQASCVSIIDGAHSIGNLPDLDITRYTLHPDAYVTNLHKWLCAPKGTALLWVSEPLQERVKPLVVSHAEGLGFAAEHLWTGTADLSPWLAVPVAIDVHKSLGLSASQEQRGHTLEKGVAALVKAFRCLLKYHQSVSNSCVTYWYEGTMQQNGIDALLLAALICVVPICASSYVIVRNPCPGCRLGAKSSELPVVVGGTGVAPGAPDSPFLDLASFPSMAAVRLPELPSYPATPFAAQDLRTALRHEHSIEVSPLQHPAVSKDHFSDLLYELDFFQTGSCWVCRKQFCTAKYISTGHAKPLGTIQCLRACLLHLAN